MSIDLVTVSPKTPFKDLWQLIFYSGVHSLPVVDEKGKLLGMIVEQDLLQPLYPDQAEVMADFTNAVTSLDDLEDRLSAMGGKTAGDVMCKTVIFTRVDTMAMRALSRMLVHRLRQLPVLDEHDHVLGIISKGDVFNGLFAKKFMKSENGKRMAPKPPTKLKGSPKKTSPAKKKKRQSKK